MAYIGCIGGRTPSPPMFFSSDFGPHPQNRDAALFYAWSAAMTFAIRHLSVLSYAQGFTLWHYKTGPAPLDEAARPGFFDDAADMLAPGDMVLVSGAKGGRILFVTATAPEVATGPLG